MISIIIPTYNEQDYLPLCLESLIKQGPDEIIVVDGGSTDKTQEIAELYGVNLSIAKGLSVGSARNFGANIAGGNIISFIDADNIPTKDWIKEIQKAFKDPQLVCVFGRSIPINSNRLDRIMSKAREYSFVNNMRLNLPFNLCQNVSYRKTAFIKARGFHPKNEYGEGIALSLKIRKKGKIRFEPKIRVFDSVRRSQQGYSNILWNAFISWVSLLLFGKTPKYVKIR